MKTITTLAIALFASLQLFATDTPRTNVITTTDGQVYAMSKMNYGFANFLIGETIDGEKVKFKSSDIQRFYKNGILYEKINSSQISTCSKGEFLPVAARKGNVVAYQQQVMNKRGLTETVWHVFADGKYSHTTCELTKEHTRRFFANQ